MSNGSNSFLFKMIKRMDKSTSLFEINKARPKFILKRWRYSHGSSKTFFIEDVQCF